MQSFLKDYSISTIILFVCMAVKPFGEIIVRGLLQYLRSNVFLYVVYQSIWVMSLLVSILF